MGLSITIKSVQEIRCPKCDELVTYKDVIEECSGGKYWYEFLEEVGYYDPVKSSVGEWYGKDMALTDDQSKKLLKFLDNNKGLYPAYLENVVSHAIAHDGHTVVINADW